MKLFLLVVLGLFLLVVAVIYFGQGSLIYYPRRYSEASPALKKVESVHYLSGGKKQWAYLFGRKEEEPPSRVWWVFSGNGSVALDWVGIVEMADPDADQVFVLFDYPGYGFNLGRPHPKTIRQSVDDALPVIGKKLGLSTDDLLARSGTVGHSLGAAVALDTASRLGVTEVVAISPFTSMRAMADRSFGGLLTPLLSHHYDNETSVDLLLKSDPEATITIFHGEKDTLIPDEMSRSLVARDADGKVVKFRAVTDAGHNDIVGKIAPELIAIFEKAD